MTTDKEKPIRVQMLETGMNLTWGARDDEYGDPKINMACAGALKATIRKYASRDIPHEELEALDMVLTKISRVVTGKPKADTYIDGGTYFCIAGEMALRATEG